MTRSGSHPTRIKHLDIKHKYIRQAIEEGQVQLEYCSTSQMLADILTKPVAKIKFATLRKGIGIFSSDP